MKTPSLSVIAAITAMVITATAQATETNLRAQPLRLAQSIPEEPIYGSQMMTEQERNEHRAQLRSAATEQERDQIRRTHHDQMRARAKERGVTLPEEPPPRGQGLGPGPGAGPGSGAGAGPGSGAGPRGGGR